jgi:hypothetical protein
VTLGPEFRVNSYTTGEQRVASVASAADGRFVVTWSGQGDGDFGGVFGQRYDAAGDAQGPEFRVNSYTTGYQGGGQAGSAVASAADGAVTVVWSSSLPSGLSDGIYGRRYDSAGNALAPEFRVNSYAPVSMRYPSVAGMPDGRFVVVWQNFGQDGSDQGIFGQRYDSTGNPAGGEFRVNSYTTNSQASPWVASADDGRFVVVWQSFGQDGSFNGVFGQRYDTAGNAAGGEFQVDSYTTGNQLGARVAMAADGRFLVAWTRLGASADVMARRYDALGNSLGPGFRVNAYTATLGGGASSVLSMADRGFVVAWSILGQDGSGWGVFARRYDSAGSPAGPEFRVNSYTTNSQSNPGAARMPDGRFVVVWHSRDQDGSQYGVFGQRFLDDFLFRDGFEGS